MKRTCTNIFIAVIATSFAVTNGYSQGHPLLKWMRGGVYHNVLDVAVSPDNNLLAMTDGQAKIFNAHDGRLIKTLPWHTVYAVAFSRDTEFGRLLALRLATQVILVRVPTWEVLRVLAYNDAGPNNWIEFTQCGKYVVTRKRAWALFNDFSHTQFGEITLKPPPTEGMILGVRQYYQVPETASVLTRSGYYSLYTGLPLTPSFSFYAEPNVAHTLDSLDPRILSAYGAGQGVTVHSSTGQLLWQDPSSIAESAAWVPQLPPSSWIYTRSEIGFLAGARDEGWVRLFRGSDYGLVFQYNGHSPSTRPVIAEFSSNNRVLSGSQDLHYWLSDGSDVLSLTAHRASGNDPAMIAYAPNGSHTASTTMQPASGWDLGIRISSPENGNFIYKSIDAGRMVSCLAYTPDSEHVLVGHRSGDLVSAYEITTGDLRYSLPSSAGAESIAVAPSGLCAVSGTSWLRLYDLSTGQLLLTKSGSYGPVAFSSDGQFLAVPLAGVPTILSVPDLNEVNRLQPFASCSSIAWSGDVVGVAGGSVQAVVGFWRPFENTSVFQPVDGEINSISFTSDGAYMLSGGKDNQLRVWSVARGERVPITTRR